MLRHCRILPLALVLLALVGCQTVPATPLIQTVVVTATPAAITPAAAPTQTPVIVVVTATPAPVTPTAVPGSSIRIVGPESDKTLTIDELEQMPATEGYAGAKSSTGKITLPTLHKGVALADLCAVVGGCDGSTAVTLVAKDGYGITFSYAQLTEGAFVTFDPGTGDEVVRAGALTPIVVYEREGKPIPAEEEGPLRLAIVSEQPNQVTDGHWAVKWVREMVIKPAITEWTLHLEGAIVEEMTRDTYESGAAPTCHENPWVDADGRKWTGISLYYLVGRVDDGNKHEGGAFNDELATKGYEVDVVAADGYTVTFDAARVSRNKSIILAHLVDGEPIEDDQWPLRLVGDDLAGNEMVSAVAQIVLRGENIVPLDTASTAAPTVPPTSAAAAAAAPDMAEGVLHIYGKVATPTAFDRPSLEQIGVEQVQVTHVKKGAIIVGGVRLTELMAACALDAAASTVVLTAGDGYSTQMALNDLLDCTDCVVELSDDGYDLAMSGMDTGLWVKDVRLIEIK